MDTTIHDNSAKVFFQSHWKAIYSFFPSAHKNKILSTSKTAIIVNYRILDYMVHNLSPL